LGFFCPICKETFERQKSNTSVVAGHLASKHHILPPPDAAPVPPARTSQTTLLFAPVPRQDASFKEKHNRCIVKLIASKQLPLSFIESPGLRDLCDLLLPGSSKLLASTFDLRPSQQVHPEGARREMAGFCRRH
jgi:hypothetical protein